jgi:hypothetical protein
MMCTTRNHKHAVNPLIVDPDSSSSEDDSHNHVFFVLCEICYWTATFIHSHQLRILDEYGCLNCKEKQSLAKFPVLPNESFKFDYSERRGIELNFSIR